jgi:hypothetical protein
MKREILPGDPQSAPALLRIWSGFGLAADYKTLSLGSPECRPEVTQKRGRCLHSLIILWMRVGDFFDPWRSYHARLR